MQAYLLTNGALGRRLHRESCKRISNFIGRIDETTPDADRVIGEARPATCCKPNREGLKQLANRARNARARNERDNADSFIKDETQKARARLTVVKDDEKSSKSPRRSAPRIADERYREAMEMQATIRRRGRGRPVDDLELATYIAMVRKADYGLSATAEHAIAWWLENMGVTRQRFSDAWAAAEAEEAKTGS